MNVSRKDIYSYVASLFTSVSKNIFRIDIPITLNADAASNGFIVLKLDTLSDNSEFDLSTFATVRMYVECYVHTTQVDGISGLMNTAKYDAAQKAIDTIIEAECKKQNQTFSISNDGILSMDDFYSNNTDAFSVYIKSFKITITNDI